MLEVTPQIQIPLEEFDLAFARSSGPGGQNVNKVNSKVQLRWKVVESPSLPEPVRARLLSLVGKRLTNEGELVITSQRFRDQQKNIDDCYDKLRELIAAAATPPVKRRPTKPSKASKQRRLTNKRVQSAKKDSRRGGGHESD